MRGCDIKPLGQLQTGHGRGAALPDFDLEASSSDHSRAHRAPGPREKLCIDDTLEEPTPKAGTVTPPAAQMSTLATVAQGGLEPGGPAPGSGAFIKLLRCGRAPGTRLPLPASLLPGDSELRRTMVLPMPLRVLSLTRAPGGKCACLAFWECEEALAGV